MNKPTRIYRFAGMEHNPHGNYWRPEARKRGVFRVVDFDDATWREENWGVGRSFGSATHEAERYARTGAGQSGSNVTWYDVRVIPTDAKKYLANIDAQIEGLYDQRKTYLREHFTEWPQVKPSDCQKIIPTTMTKTQAKQKAAEANKKSRPTTSQLKEERNLIDGLNHTIFGQ